MKVIIFILLLPIFTTCFSQVDTIRLDSKKLDSINNVYKDGYHIFKNGDKIIEEGNYKDNCAVGTWKYYYPEGMLKSIINYICVYHGRSDESGQYIEFYKTGQIRLEGTYLKNDSIECVECYDPMENNKKIQWSEYAPPLKTGEWKEYYENGKLKSIGKYYQGIHQTFNTEYLKNESPADISKIAISTISVDYLKDNNWKYYNVEGRLIKTEYYRRGLLIGEETIE